MSEPPVAPEPPLPAAESSSWREKSPLKASKSPENPTPPLTKSPEESPLPAAAAVADASAKSPPQTPQKTSLYVGDLHPDVSESELILAFSRQGFEASVHLCRDSVSAKSLCYAYANFASHSEAARALACLNHTNLMGKDMRIMWSERDPLPRKTGIGNLYVKNLDSSIDSSRLHSIFCTYGAILSCKVAENKGKSKGFGYVQFDSDGSAESAVKALHDTMIEGKKLYVSKFIKKSERKAANEELEFTNLYVKNLSKDLTEDVLRDKFSEFGKVCSAVIMKDGKGKSRGFGFVNFEFPQEAKKATEALNGAAFGLKKLFVGKAQKKSEREEYMKRQHAQKLIFSADKLKASNLYVKFLDASVDDKKLLEHFSAMGKVTSAKVMCDNSGKSRGFGFVSFSSPEAANKALQILHGTTFCGKTLYVAIAQRKEDRCRLLQSSHAYPRPSNWGGLLPLQFPPPGFVAPPCPPNFLPCMSSYQPNLCHSFGNRSRGLYPYPVPPYQPNYPPCTLGQTQQRNSRDWVQYQHPTAHTVVQNYGFKKQANRGYGSSGTSLKGPAAARYPATPNASGSKKSLGELLYPLVQNLQPECAGKITKMLMEKNKSDIMKLINSPNTLGVEVEKGVRELREKNARTGANAGVALQITA